MTDPSELENQFIDAAGEVAEHFSVNRIVGQLYALLYIRPDPVSLDEMAERLRISKGSASVNIRILEEWNAVKKTWVQGSRKDFYTANPDIYKIVSQRLQQGLVRRLNHTRSKVDQIHSALNGKNGGAKTQFYRERLQKLEELQTLSETIVKFLPKIQSLKSIKTIASLL